jgi:predicted dehydrogenase
MKPLRVGIIGCGGYVRSHVNAIKEHVPEMRIVALVDVEEKKLRRFRAAHLPRRRAGLYTDHRRMLEEAAPDAVVVSTPHTLHFRHAYDAIRAGAHVLVDKPMVTSSADARRLVAAAEKHHRNLQIAVQGTYTDTFAYARKLLADGTMGPLQLATGILAQGWMKGTAGRWRQDPKLSGGGQLYDSTAHVLSAMMFLVDSPVREVFCWADNKGCKVDINAVACVRFEGGCMATVTSGGNCATFYSHLVLQGENALLEISPHGGSFRVTGRGLERDITAVPKGWDVPTVSPVRNFADVLFGLAEPRCGGRLGILLAELMDGIYASAAKGRPVKITRD